MAKTKRQSSKRFFTEIAGRVFFDNREVMLEAVRGALTKLAGCSVNIRITVDKKDYKRISSPLP